GAPRGLRPASYRSSLAARCAPARREPNLSWCQRRNLSSQRRYLIAAKAISILWSATAMPGPPKVWYWCGGLSALDPLLALIRRRGRNPGWSELPLFDHYSQSVLLNFSRKISPS